MNPDLKRNLGDTLLLLTVLGSLASIYALEGSGSLIFAAVLSIGVLAIFSVRIINRLRRRRQVPSCRLEPVPVYSIKHAASDDIHWIANLEKSTYDADDSIPENKLREWYQVNPTGFFLILEDGMKIGHIDILPIREDDSTFDLFLNGRIKEINITRQSLYPTDQKQSIRRLYVESVIIVPQDTRKHGETAAFKYLLAHFISLIKAIAIINNVQYIYAIGATEDGQYLLTTLGFDVETSADQRIDGHNLYRVSLPVLAERIHSRIRHYNVSEQAEFDELLRKAVESGL